MTGLREVDEILRRPYHWVLIPDADGCVAYIEEFQGCATQGDTPEEAVRCLREAAELWLSTVIEDGQAVPEPRPHEWEIGDEP
jgi:predicted RNase H-like HicB family nuclease